MSGADERPTIRGRALSAVHPRLRGSRCARDRVATLTGVLLASAVLLSAAAAPATAAATDPADTTFQVALQEDGDAEVSLRLAFDVSTPEDRQALERLRANGSAVAEEFAGGLAAVAAGAEARTGREMSVSEPSMAVTTEGSTGYVTLSVAWSGLAAVDGDSLRVSAPFDDGFRPPGRFVIRAPEGYALTGASPAPASESDMEAVWEAGASMEGFEATFAPAEAGGGIPPRSMPGFGLAAGGVALAAVLALLDRGVRRRS